MPAPLAQALAKLNELQAKTDAATGYADLLEDLLVLLAGENNEFGTAATADTGTAEGDVPILGAEGVLAQGQIPRDMDFGAVTLDEDGDANASVNPRRAVNARQLERAITWAITPSTTLFGDLDATTGGTLLDTTGTVIQLTDFASNYRRWVVRFQRPGQTQVRERSLANALASGEWIDVLSEGSGALAYRQRPGTPNLRRIELRSGGAPGYRLLSIRGVNDTRFIHWAALLNVPALFATTWAMVQNKPLLWDRGVLYHVATSGAPNLVLTQIQGRGNGAIEIAGGGLTSDPVVTFPEDGVWAVLNTTNRTLRLRTSAPTTNSIGIPSGRGDVVMRAGVNMVSFLTSRRSAFETLWPAVAEVTGLNAALAARDAAINLRAPLASPAFTGTPTVPTPARPS